MPQIARRERREGDRHGEPPPGALVPPSAFQYRSVGWGRRCCPTSLRPSVTCLPGAPYPRPRFPGLSSILGGTVSRPRPLAFSFSGRRGVLLPDWTAGRCNAWLCSDGRQVLSRSAACQVGKCSTRPTAHDRTTLKPDRRETPSAWHTPSPGTSSPATILKEGNQVG